MGVRFEFQIRGVLTDSAEFGRLLHTQTISKAVSPILIFLIFALVLKL